MVIHTTGAVWVAAGLGSMVVLLWFGLPLFRRAQYGEPGE
jgi:hypothetical protein